MFPNCFVYSANGMFSPINGIRHASRPASRAAPRADIKKNRPALRVEGQDEKRDAAHMSDYRERERMRLPIKQTRKSGARKTQTAIQMTTTRTRAMTASTAHARAPTTPIIFPNTNIGSSPLAKAKSGTTSRTILVICAILVSRAISMATFLWLDFFHIYIVPLPPYLTATLSATVSATFPAVFLSYFIPFIIILLIYIIIILI